MEQPIEMADYSVEVTMCGGALSPDFGKGIGHWDVLISSVFKKKK